ncbi:MAG TPA: Rieske 2Fe-2S domain-containing protein [Stellaceae bacterium]|nr:Rieske 2Fe-2S domain-containing protein [Stellaceae bacterium]
MLRHEDSERLARVGPGTPAGELFRRYWQPAALAAELAERDGPPLRVRLLGEDLIAFRDSAGRVGLVDAFCPHRRAPLFFGRNEECGLRCVYHGWKFDVAGACVDMPSEPADSPLKAEVRLKSYPTVERGGIVWAYLGPPRAMPAEPDYEWTRAPATHRAVSKSHQSNNYLQALEGGLDTAHVSFLHNNRIGDRNNLFTRDGAPRIEVFETDYGYHYVATRKIDAAQNLVRVYQYILPFQQMRPNVTQTGLSSNFKVPRYDGHIWVPIDDGETAVYNWMCGYDAAAALDPDYVERLEAGYGRGRDDYIPGTDRLKANAANDYFIDRAAQKTTSFTGITGINTQDMAVQEGMGAITDRSREYLASSDRAITVLRRMLLEATRAVERGETPRGTDPETYRAVRPHDGLVPAGGDWRTAFAGASAAQW